MDSLSKGLRLQVPVDPLRRACHAQNCQNQENLNLVRTNTSKYEKVEVVVLAKI